MVKKHVLLLFLLTMGLSIESAGLFESIKGIRVSLSVMIDNDHGTGEIMPRDLVEIPTVSIDGNILYFYDVFSTTVPVFVVDASDNVVFSATLYPGEDKKILPTSLSGTYTLYMRVGTIMYYGNLII